MGDHFAANGELRRNEDAGTGLVYFEKGRGTPVVCVHGGISDYRAWTYQVEVLSRSHRLMLVNRRYAHPRAPGAAERYTVDDNAADLAALLRSAGVGPAHFMGHSYSGLVLLRLAQRWPELTRSLVLAEPAIPQLVLGGTLKPSPLYMFRLMRTKGKVVRSLIKFRMGSANRMEKAIRAGDFESALSLFLGGVTGGHTVGRYPEVIREMMHQNAKSLIVDSDASGFESFTGQSAAEIRVPTLLLKGENSPLFLKEVTDILAGSMPNCEHRVVAGASHFMFIESPARFNTYVEDFLSRQN